MLPGVTRFAKIISVRKTVRLMNSPFQAERLFSRCFTEEQLAYLQAQPEFVEAAQKIDSLKAAIEVVELGDKILRRKNQASVSFSGH